MAKVTQPNAKKAEAKAKEIIATRSTEGLVECFELTSRVQITFEVSVVRGWIMDQLEARDAAAFDAWMNSEEESPRKFYA